MVFGFEVCPRRSVGPIQFGMPREAARGAMGGAPHRTFKRCPSEVYEIDCYTYENASFHISYAGNAPVVDFIEISSSPHWPLDAILWGVSVFRTKAADLIDFVSKSARYDENDPPGYAFCFSSLDIAFWREMLPEDDPEMEFFQVVSAGRDGYYSRGLEADNMEKRHPFFVEKRHPFFALENEEGCFRTAGPIGL